MKKVLVTGADGFIGSHLTESLLERGYDVRAFVYYNSFNTWGWLDTLPKEKLDQIEIFAGDVRDPNGVREAMRGVDGVFHLAALIAIPFSYHSPDSYVDTNIKGTLNVLQAARELQTERVMERRSMYRLMKSIRSRDSRRIRQLRSEPTGWLRASTEAFSCRCPLSDRLIHMVRDSPRGR